jgi:hypothetical protein
VIAIITVKSNMEKADLLSGLDNLASVINTDLRFRRSRLKEKNGESIFSPIAKYFISYKQPNDPSKTGPLISSYYRKVLYENQLYTNYILKALKTIDPMNPSRDIIYTIRTFIPNMIFSLEEKDASFFPGWGPPKYIHGNKKYGPEKVSRLPYLYKQNNIVTTQLDKFVSDLLQVVNKYLGTPGWSTAAAWADIHPVFGFRMGVSSEIDEQNSWPLIKANKSKIVVPERKLEMPEGWI